MSKEVVIMSMKPLIEQARRERKWLRSDYQGLVFTPEELEREQNAGFFCWGPSNWRLVNPHELLDEASREVVEARRNATNLLDRITKWGESL